MKDASTVPSPVPASTSRGIPGVYARSRGFSQALSPFIAMVFGAGWVFGAILSPGFLQGSHAAILLMLIALGLFITWKRAVIILVRHEEGARGEEQVARVLDALPESWRVFHSVELASGEMDHVLVSDHQVFTIETVHWRGQVRVVNGKLMHGENFYPGYELETLHTQAVTNAEDLGLPESSVTPMVCIVGGRYGDYAGVKNGVWLGEIQDIGFFLCSSREGHLPEAKRADLLRMLEEKTISAKKEKTK
ncbi:MAG: nuclease-related domain-containing protein [Kiritimatiellia bacterium]